jgi:hypothetical protein
VPEQVVGYILEPVTYWRIFTMPMVAGKKYSYDKEGMAAAAKASAMAKAKPTATKNPMNPMSSPPKAA